MDCGEECRVYPSFVLSGTTLTLSALLFTAFVYETSKLTWRDLSEKFCTDKDRIAHSTLYKAVHGLGKNLLEQNKTIREGIRKLHAAYLPQGVASLPGYPRVKAMYDHTREREAALWELLLPLCGYNLMESLFSRAFYHYLKPLRLIFSCLDPPVLKLYNKA
jgi:hypothetical protein